MNAFVGPDDEAKAVEALAEVYREAWVSADERREAGEPYDMGDRSRAGIEAVLARIKEAIQRHPIGWRSEWEGLIRDLGTEK